MTALATRLRDSFRVWILLAMATCGAVPASAGDAGVLVRTAEVISQQVTETLSAFGVLDPDPDQVLSLSMPHAGLINRVWVRLGQRVRSGDQLLEVITAPDARMQFLQAQSAVDYAQRELERQQRLLGEQLATKAQVDAAARNLADAQATLNALVQRGQGVEQDTLRAPTDGIITQLNVSQGQRVQADTTAILIAAEKRLIARLGVEPEDLPRILPGSKVTVTSVFVPGVAIETRIREVHAMIDPSTHLVEVLAPIPEEQSGSLILGSRVTGQIQLASRETMVVPRSAVLFEGNEAYVFVVSSNTARRVVVRPGVASGELTEISSGLSVGDVVVVSGNYELSDGASVRASP